MGFWRCMGKASLCAAKVIGESVVGAVDGAIDATKDEFDKDHSGRSKKSIALRATANILGSAVGRGAKAGFHSLGEEVENFQQFAEVDAERDRVIEERKHQEYLARLAWEKESKKREEERVQERIALSKAENLHDFRNAWTEIVRSKVAGVTDDNRQEYIKELVVGEFLEARREPDNPDDSNAIALYAQGHKIGYLKKHFASDFARTLDFGGHINVMVYKITGNVEDPLDVGIAIEYKVNTPPLSSRESHSRSYEDEYRDWSTPDEYMDDEEYSDYVSERYRGDDEPPY